MTSPTQSPMDPTDQAEAAKWRHRPSDAAVMRTVRLLAVFVANADTVSTFRENPMRDDVLAAMPTKIRDRFLQFERDVRWPVGGSDE